MYDGRNGSSSPFEQTVYLLSEAGRAAERLLADRLDHRGMTSVHRALLSTLARLGPHGRDDLIARVTAPAAEADRALDDLVAAELLRSMVVHIGGRQEVLTITTVGRSALDVLHADASATQEDLLASLTKGQRVELNSLLRRVCATAARGVGPRPVLRESAGWTLTAGPRRTWTRAREGADATAGPVAEAAG
ncbi:hypothetical protein ACGF13_29210 [Kitasatospora sp. NPDC048286]|uniref:hypothetical protein n=1 Tax=Kitasatospora sp. NPDC048286 TaxID=3364047 RepID=UPI00371D6656